MERILLKEVSAWIRAAFQRYTVLDSFLLEIENARTVNYVSLKLLVQVMKDMSHWREMTYPKYL